MFFTSKQSKLASVFLDNVLLSWDLSSVTHLTIYLSFSSSGITAQGRGKGPLKGAKSAQKAFQGSKTDMNNLLKRNERELSPKREN